MVIATSSSSGNELPNAAAVERTLLAHRSVRDCAVIARTAADGSSRLVAFVVPLSSHARGPIRDEIARLRDEYPSLGLAYVSAIPLTESGGLDDCVLDRIPVLEPSVLDDIARRCCRAVPDAKVVVRDVPRRMAVSHIWDLLGPPATVATSPAPEALGIDTVDPAATRPSVVHGPPLADDPSRPATLVDTLVRAAHRHPDHGVTYLDTDGREEVQTYGALLDEASRILAGLRRVGLVPGDRILLQLDRNRDFVPAFWGCLLGGFVPVPTAVIPSYEDAAAVARLTNAWEMLHRPLIIAGDAAARVLRHLAARDLPGLRVESVNDLRVHAPDATCHVADSGDVALMMLTSGSTGVPKGVLLTHRNLIARAAASQQMNGFSHDDITLNWMPLDHVAGIVYFHLRDVFLGARQVHAQTARVLQRPTVWIDWLDRFRVTITFAPNFAFGLVNDCTDEIRRARWDLSCVRHVLNGAEAIIPRTARRFLTQLAPFGLSPTAMRPAWGMSETSSGVVYSSRFSLAASTDDDRFVEVGEPIPGLSIRIVDQRLQPVDEGTPGRLQVAGAVVTSGYFERPDLNAAAFTSDGWFDTGDVATLGDGQLTITGREKDDIVINSVKYYAHEIEAIVDELPVTVTSFTAACAVRSAAADSEELAVFFVPSAAGEAAVVDAVHVVRQAVTRRVGVSPAHVLPVAISDIPKTAVGKIQRLALRRRFEAGGFTDIVKRFDIVTRSARTMPDWFYRPVWRRREVSPGPVAGDGRVVAFLRHASQRAIVDDALSPSKITVVLPGTQFERHSGTHEADYCVRPDRTDDYTQLFAELEREQGLPGTIVHLWNWDEAAGGAGADERTGHVPALELVALVRALALANASERRIRLIAVTTGASRVHDTEAMNPAHAAALAVLMTAAQENSWLAGRTIDVPAGSSSDLSIGLRAEAATHDREEAVAYRDGARWVKGLESMDLTASVARPLPFRRGGFYVVSGGLGGISAEVSRVLLREFEAKLLLLGRTRLDPGNAHESASTSGQRTFEELAAIGDVRYAAVDVADREALRRAVAEASAAWNQTPDGVMHLAGVYRERLLAEETSESFADAVRAKMDGTTALVDVLGGPDALFVGSSSVNGWFGGVGAGAYAAANAFLDATVQNLAGSHISAHAIAWSQWDGIGMSADRERNDWAMAKGYVAIPARQGVNALLAALSRSSGHILVGLDGTAPHISSRSGAVVPLESIAIEASPADHTAINARIAETRPRDRFGVAVACAAIDPPAHQTKADRARVQPQSETERAVAACWKRVLRLDDVDVVSNFFDVGGTSLLIAQLSQQLRTALGREVAITELFTYPTIRALATRLDQPSTETAAPESDRLRGEQRRQRIQRLRGRAAR